MVTSSANLMEVVSEVIKCVMVIAIVVIVLMNITAVSIVCDLYCMANNLNSNHLSNFYYVTKLLICYVTGK